MPNTGSSIVAWTTLTLSAVGEVIEKGMCWESLYFLFSFSINLEAL